eukprot:COSAG06_NODE_38346_length_424_cov_2.886154_1_plen_44_part_10
MQYYTVLHYEITQQAATKPDSPAFDCFAAHSRAAFSSRNRSSSG